MAFEKGQLDFILDLDPHMGHWADINSVGDGTNGSTMGFDGIDFNPCIFGQYKWAESRGMRTDWRDLDCAYHGVGRDAAGGVAIGCGTQ